MLDSLHENGDEVTDDQLSLAEKYAGECKIRDLYSRRLTEFRPAERLLGTESMFEGSSVRADMRTVDEHNVLRIWEFKIFAGYEGLGQALTYLALARKAVNFDRPVKGVLAAFDFQSEIVSAVEVLNLGIELVAIPPKLRHAGGVPLTGELPQIVDIPFQPHLRATTEEFR